MRVRPGVELAGLSDVGCQRENNEDRYSYWEPANDLGVPDARAGWPLWPMAWADTKAARKPAASRLRSSKRSMPNGAEGDPRAWLLQGFQAAHQRIQEYADKYPDLHGMGTTCTAMALLDHQLYFAHVGDSRLYLVRGSTISRLTHDHSYVSRLVENGVLRAEEAESHPQRHILTAALGAGNQRHSRFSATARRP